jgi:hypothetical protein
MREDGPELSLLFKGFSRKRDFTRGIDCRMSKKIKINQRMQEWIDARRRRHLSHCHVQIARELGLNPAKLGKIDNHKQETWKLPLPRFIEHLYFKRFGKTTPDNVVSIEERCRVEGTQREARRIARQQRRMDSA